MATVGVLAGAVPVAALAATSPTPTAGFTVPGYKVTAAAGAGYIFTAANDTPNPDTSVHVYTPSGTAMPTIDLGALVTSLTPSRDGSRIYAVLGAAKAVSVIDTNTRTEVARYDASAIGTPVQVAEAGSRLVVGGLLSGQAEVGVVDMTAAAPKVVDLMAGRPGLAARESAPGVSEIYLAGCSYGACTLGHYTYTGGPGKTVNQEIMPPDSRDLVLSSDASTVISAEAQSTLTLRSADTLAPLTTFAAANDGAWLQAVAGHIVQAGYDAASGKYNSVEVRTMTGALTSSYTSTNDLVPFVDPTNSTDVYFREYGTDGKWHIRSLPGALVDPPAPIAPATPTGLTATARAAGHVALSWTAPVAAGNDPTTAYQVLRSTDPAQAGVAIATPTTTSYDDSGLRNGVRYYYRVVATGPGGSSAPSAQVAATADAAAPTVRISGPATAFQLNLLVTARYAASDAVAGIASYDVRYRIAPWNGGFGSYVYPSTRQGTTATSMTLSGTPGRTYCVGVRARDRVGNTSAWSADRCTAIPLDDRSLATATTGWTRVTSSTAFRHTLTRSSKASATLRLSRARVHRVALVVTRCPTCGTIAIYLDGRYWRAVSTYASVTQYRIVLSLPVITTRTATVTLKKASTSRQVHIDGLGLSQG